MNTITIADILDLSVQDRLHLVEAIWDSIAAVPEAVELSDIQRAELDRRLAAFEQDSVRGSPWSVVRARIKQA